jgi:predicted DNA-binding ribbon-helix-helix protein
MKKKIRFNVSKTKSYRCGFPQELLNELREEAKSRGVSVSMHIQEILESNLAPRLSELIKQSMRNSIEYEYTSFVITEDFFKTLADASRSVNLNVPELCRDVLSNRQKVNEGNNEEQKEVS